MEKYYAKIVVEFEAENGDAAFAIAEEMGDVQAIGTSKAFVEE